MNKMEWTNEAVMEFLEGYQAEPCLWDPQHPDHRNRNKVADAWERLHGILKFACSLNDLKKKKDSLMASFRMLLNKKKKCIKSGMAIDELFKPTWFAFEAMEKFLAPVYHCAPSIDTEIRSTENEDTNSHHVNINESEDINNYNQADEKDDVDMGDKEEAEKIVPEKTMPTTRKQIKPQRPVKTININKDKTSQNASEKRMDEALHILKDVAQKRKESEKDECDLYGELLAQKLRRYDEEEREEIMLEIDSMLLKRKKAKVVQIIPVPTPSPTYTIYTELTSPSSSLSYYAQPVDTQTDKTSTESQTKIIRVFNM